MQFAVKALRQMESATLVFDASNADDARQLAESQGYAVITVRPLGRAALRFGGRARFPLVQFSQSLLTLLEAGLSLVESIDALAEREVRSDVKQTLNALLKKLYEGQTLSAALAAQPAAFPALYVATIRANERTGGLTEAIGRFIQYRHQIDIVKKRVISAAIYPALILAVGGLVILFLMLYVVPRFSQVFEDLGDKIPYLSKVLLEWGQFVHANALIVLSIALALPLFMTYILSRPSVRSGLGRMATRIPRMGEYIRIYQLARFYRSLGMLLRGGIPILGALDMVASLLPASLHAGLGRARNDIREGQPLSAAFDTHGLSTPVSLRMLRVGERTGQMGEMMERIAGFFDEDVADAIDWFIRLFEPILMIFIGMVIGVIVLLMYAPIFELAGSIQ
jgi:general secretion pathway protein F